MKANEQISGTSYPTKWFVKSFERRLDKFWRKYKIRYDFEKCVLFEAEENRNRINKPNRESRRGSRGGFGIQAPMRHFFQKRTMYNYVCMSSFVFLLNILVTMYNFSYCPSFTRKLASSRIFHTPMHILFSHGTFVFMYVL